MHRSIFLVCYTALIATSRATLVGAGTSASFASSLATEDLALLSSVFWDVRPPAPPGATLTVSVIALGGDPTGAADASDALDAAVAAAAAVQNRSAGDFWPLGSHRVTIDLGGGVFSVSRPLLLHGSNASQTTLSGGALVASASFPRDGYLVDIGGWALGVTLTDVVLDAAHVCGGIRVNGAEQTTVDRVFVVHYASTGLLGDDAAGQSNELLVTHSYFAEFQWGEPGFNVTAQQNGTGIDMRFCDSHFVSVIVRCTRVGVVDDGGGNLYAGVHIYSTCNKDGPANVATGLVVMGESTRVVGCNFDDSPVLVTAAVDVLISGSVFYGLSGLVFAPQVAAIPWARGVLVTGNTFRGTAYATNPTIAYDTAAGSLDVSHLSGFVVADNSFSEGAATRATRATAVVSVAVPAGGAPPCAGFSGALDLSGTLIFRPPPAPPVHHAPAVADTLLRMATRARRRYMLPSPAPSPASFSTSPSAPAAAPYPPGVASVSGAFSLADPAPLEFGVFNAAPTATFGVFNVSAARLFLGTPPPPMCGVLTGAITLIVDQAAPAVA